MRMRWLRTGILLVGLAAAMAGPADAAPVDDSLSESMSAAEAEGDQEKSEWNEFDLGFMSLRLGGGFLVDTAAYVQNEASEQQLALDSDVRLRDFRILLKGEFEGAPRLSYSIGYMYDGPSDDWRFRQTGLMLKVPALSGYLFVGRTKEGFSTNKFMVGYDGWTIERAAANEALIPILADGARWTGTGFDGRLVYNLGAFVGSVSDEPYVRSDRQLSARAVWLPLDTAGAGRAGEGSILHLALQARLADSDDGTLLFRSRPESFPAQEFAIDTGEFAADGSTILGAETYYRAGPLTLGTEYFFDFVSAPQSGDPFFHGGEVFAAYILTGETRAYNESAALFQSVSPERSFFSGGPGAWELVTRLSYADFESGPVDGGRFWRITPMVNWHLSDNARLEFVYGYSLLERDGLIGGTSYFQSRLQLTLE